MPRKDTTLAEKIALLDQIKTHPPDTSHRRLSEFLGVPKSTIARLIHLQDKFREEWAWREGHQNSSQKRKRRGKNPDVDKALDEWFTSVLERGLCVNGPMLRIKSEELAKNLGYNNFKATDGWLSRWKARRCITFKKPRIGDITEPPASKTSPDWNFTPEVDYSNDFVEIAADKDKSLDLDDPIQISENNEGVEDWKNKSILENGPSQSDAPAESLEDEYDLFGKYVAAQLKRMGIKTAFQTKADILSVLSSARLKELGESEKS